LREQGEEVPDFLPFFISERGSIFKTAIQMPRYIFGSFPVNRDLGVKTAQLISVLPSSQGIFRNVFEQPAP
jgi:hypothetical protein